MANKFIVFVVLAAAVQVSSAATDLKTAEEASRAEWRQVGETICRAVQDKSWSIRDARKEYQTHQAAGGKTFSEAAHLADYPALQALASAESTANQEFLFKALREARECSDYVETTAAIRVYKNSLPYGRFLTAFHAVTKDTGSVTPAVDALKKVYETLFNEMQKLATSVCGGAEASGTCALEEIHEAVDAQTKIIYSWL